MVPLGRATHVPHNNSKEHSGTLSAVYEELRGSTKTNCVILTIVQAQPCFLWAALADLG